MNNQKRLLELAIKGLEAERVGIEREIAELTLQTSGTAAQTIHAGSGAEGSSPVRRKRGKMSAAQKRRIAETMKAKWAARRAQAGNAGTTKHTKVASGNLVVKPSAQQKPGGNLSAAGRKKISDMMKARWAAKRKAAGKK